MINVIETVVVFVLVCAAIAAGLLGVATGLAALERMGTGSQGPRRRAGGILSGR